MIKNVSDLSCATLINVKTRIKKQCVRFLAKIHLLSEGGPGQNRGVWTNIMADCDRPLSAMLTSEAWFDKSYLNPGTISHLESN